MPTIHTTIDSIDGRGTGWMTVCTGIMCLRGHIFYDRKMCLICNMADLPMYIAATCYIFFLDECCDVSFKALSFCDKRDTSAQRITRQSQVLYSESTVY